MPPKKQQAVAPGAPDQLPRSILERALALLRRALGPSPKLSEIAGDASTRRFFRARSRSKTAVLMIHPDPLHPSSPLYSNHRVLQAIGAPVPKILGSDDRAGLVLVEDFGDITLQRRLAAPGPRRRTAGPVRARTPAPRPRSTRPPARGKAGRGRIYRQACDLIVLMQTRAAEALRPDDFASRNALDIDRFLFEMDHFHRHFIVGLRGMKPDDAEETLLRAFFVDLSQDCDRMPRAYCHRDFQSRNLMVRKARLHLIDFQDARMGPYTYDAASLLRDSSLDLEEGLVEEMIAYLAPRLGAGPEEFRRDFDRMALERNLKDLGTFGYMATVRGLSSYLDYIPRTIRSLKRTLLRDGRYHFVYPVLEKHVLSYKT